jgi:hypothetical protein
VIELSSSLDEEDSFDDTSCDFEFTQCFYGKLNRDLLEPPGDSKIIILSDSDEEKEGAHEEKSASAKDESTSAVVNSVSTTSADDAALRLRSLRLEPPLLSMSLKNLGWCQMIVVMVWPRVRRWGRAAVVETKLAHLRLSRQE